MKVKDVNDRVCEGPLEIQDLFKLTYICQLPTSQTMN